MADAPALPWGVPLDKLQPQPEPRRVVFASSEQSTVSVGEKIEVRWFLHYEEEPVDDQDEGTDDKDSEAHKDKASQEPPKTRWWAATILGPAPASATSKLDSVSNTQAYELLYEPYEQFQAECCSVIFTGAHTLIDVSQPNDELVWRKEGDSWEPAAIAVEQEASSEEAEEEGDVEEPVYSLADLLAEPTDAAAAAAELDEMQGMDAYKQRLMASGLRDVFDGLHEFISHKPADYIVTTDDVHSLFEQLRSKRPRTH